MVLQFEVSGLRSLHRSNYSLDSPMLAAIRFLEGNVHFHMVKEGNEKWSAHSVVSIISFRKWRMRDNQRLGYDFILKFFGRWLFSTECLVASSKLIHRTHHFILGLHPSGEPEIAYQIPLWIWKIGFQVNLPFPPPTCHNAVFGLPRRCVHWLRFTLSTRLIYSSQHSAVALKDAVCFFIQ